MAECALPTTPGGKPRGTAPPPPPAWRHWLWVGALFVALLYILPSFVHQTPQTKLTYSQFISDVNAHKIKTVILPSAAASGANVTATGTLTGGRQFSTVIPTILAGPSLSARLQSAHVAVTGPPAASSFARSFLAP